MDFNVSSKKEQRGILAGMLLGGGRKNKNNFFIQHPQQQEDYLCFKKSLLEEITRKPVLLSRKTNHRGEVILRIEPKLIPLTRVLIQRLYSGNIPVITRKFLDFLTPQGIALWFMDRGTKSLKKRQGKVCALEIFLNTRTSRPESEIIITYFAEVWGIHWGLSKAKRKIPDCYRLRLGTKAGKEFSSFVQPYIYPSLLDKIEPSYNETATI